MFYFLIVGGPAPAEQCALPLQPEIAIDEGEVQGTRFGGHKESRLEYEPAQVPDNRLQRE